MPRVSNHIEPVGALEYARHYIKEVVYGANDGIITTFAVVAGVSGGGLSPRVVLICGMANLIADGLSMAVGNYLSLQSHERVLEARGLPIEEAFPWRHGLATFGAFVVAGAVPLAPYLLPGDVAHRFAWSVVVAFATLFAVGSARALTGSQRWWAGGMEMLGLGAIVTAVAYGTGALMASLIGGA
jgi:VIT1/CCC1 family predicted Fe2+/Mn2+ transporter